MASSMVVRSRTSLAEFGDLGEDAPDLAIFLGLAIGAAPIGDLAQARKRRDRAVEDAQHLPEGDAIGGHEQAVAAELAAPALHDAVPLELEQDLLEELARDSLLGGDLADHQRVGARQRDEGVEGVSCFL